MDKVKCPICGELIDNETYVPCPYCAWSYTGIEDLLEPDEIEEFNLMTVEEAKKLLKEGKNKWGDPLPKKE